MGYKGVKIHLSPPSTQEVRIIYSFLITLSSFKDSVSFGVKKIFVKHIFKKKSPLDGHIRRAK